ncbi:MAG: GTP 3',8-cyclase MoaA [Chloroflexi bacterium]|nr:GTP 3',8-cyclase MoaA [Chloroflexota bacterium]
MTGLSDSFQRPINYLRISVTDRCNLRCIYCMPADGIALLSHDRMLSYEEIRSVASAAVELGINKIRLTGGEPLVRLAITKLIHMLAAIPGIDDISLTTNGILLSRYAGELKAAGLNRVNISLDTLNIEKFQKIARMGKLQDVLDGIKAAQKAGLQPVKINTVVMRGVNDEELLDFARSTIKQDWHVRFIELMPFQDKHQFEKWFMPRTEIEQKIKEIGRLEPVLHSTGNGPAKYFRIPGAIGTIGFISSVTEHICVSCNRLRLTADGRLRPCLLSDLEINLRDALRSGAGREDLKKLIAQAVASKPKGHQLEIGSIPVNRNMAQIGG